MTTAIGSPVEIIQLGVGDQIPLSEILHRLILMGIATNVLDPNNFSFTADAFNNQATLTVPVVQGPIGNSGSDALPLKFMNDTRTEPQALPTDLLDGSNDLGKFWVFAIEDDDGNPIATTMFVWTGTVNGPLTGQAGLGQGFVQLPVGTPGSPGPYPVITPQIVTLATGNGGGPGGADSWVTAMNNWVITVNALGGAYTLSVTIGGVTKVTGNINYNATPATIQTALAALTNVGAGNVSVITGSGLGNDYDVIFIGALSQTPVTSFFANVGTLTGAGTLPPIIVETDTSHPVLTFNIAVPQGLQGPSAPLGSLVNVDFQTTPPKPGDALVVSSRVTPGPPTSLGVAPSGSGGHFTAGTYFWWVTATLPGGETVVSNRVTATLSGSASSALLSWTAPAGGGAAGYNIYRGPNTTTQQLVGVVTSGAQLSFTDLGGGAVPAKVPPTVGILAGKNIWVNSTNPFPNIPFYTIPQAAFANGFTLDIASWKTACTYTLPAQPWPYVPIVTGCMRVSGINLGLTPLLISAGVWAGTQSSGTQVAQGFSHLEGTVTMFPYFTTAITPSTPIVAANTAQLYTIALFNNGIIAMDIFSNANAEAVIMVFPIGTW
jgi:hypothetical protein